MFLWLLRKFRIILHQRNFGSNKTFFFVIVQSMIPYFLKMSIALPVAAYSKPIVSHSAFCSSSLIPFSKHA